MILNLDINSVLIVLCNLYVPNLDDLDFFKTLTNAYLPTRIRKYYYGDDFNFIVTNLLNYLNRHSKNWKVKNYFVNWAEKSS